MQFEDLKFDETMKLSLECLASLRSTHMMRRGKVRIMLSDHSGRFRFTVMNFKSESGFGSGTLSDLWWLKAPSFDNLNEACKFLCKALDLSVEMFLIFHEAVSEVDQIRMLTTDMLANKLDEPFFRESIFHNYLVTDTGED